MSAVKCLAAAAAGAAAAGLPHMVNEGPKVCQCADDGNDV